MDGVAPPGIIGLGSGAAAADPEPGATLRTRGAIATGSVSGALVASDRDAAADCTAMSDGSGPLATTAAPCGALEPSRRASGTICVAVDADRFGSSNGAAGPLPWTCRTCAARTGASGTGLEVIADSAAAAAVCAGASGAICATATCGFTAKATVEAVPGTVATISAVPTGSAIESRTCSVSPFTRSVVRLLAATTFTSASSGASALLAICTSACRARAAGSVPASERPIGVSEGETASDMPAILTTIR